MDQTALERARALAAKQAAAPQAPALGPVEKARLLAEKQKQQEAFDNPDSVMALRPHSLSDVLVSTPTYATVEDANRDIRVSELVNRIKNQGGVPYSVEAASGFVDATQAGFANQIDAIKAARDGERLRSLGINVRTALGSLPFVPAREPSQEARDIAQAIDIVKAQQAKDSFGHAVAGTAGSLGGVLYGLSVAGAPAKVLSGGIQAARGIQQASTLQKVLTGAAQFGTYEAMPSLEGGQPVEAAKDFAKGSAVGLALEATGGLAGKLPLPFIAKPVAQTATLSGVQYAETGQLPSKNEAGALALTLGLAGVPAAMRAKPAKPSDLRAPTAEELRTYQQPIQPTPVDPMAQWAGAEAGQAKSGAVSAKRSEAWRKAQYIKANGSLRGYQPETPAESFLGNAGQKNRFTEVIDPATGVKSVRDRFADPSQLGERPPQESYETVAGSPNRFTEVVDPATGTVTVRDRFADPERLGQRPPQENYEAVAGAKNRFSETTDTATGSRVTRDTRPESVPPQEEPGFESVSMSAQRGAKKPIVSAYETETGSFGPIESAGSVEKVRSTSFPDPAASAVAEGNRSLYLLPSNSLPTAFENQMRKSLPKPEELSKQGIGYSKTSIGDVLFRPELIERDLSKPENADVANLVVRTQSGSIDVPRTIESFVKADKIGRLLYGKGNDSKASGNAFVTGRDRAGNEIASVVAGNVETASKALKDAGAISIEVKPLESGTKEIFNERIRNNKREGGFVNLGIFSRGKTPNERRLELDEEYKSDPKNKVFPQYDLQAQSFPDIYEAGVKAMSAQGAATRLASEDAIRLWKSLGGDPQKVHLFMRNLVEAQGVGLRAQGRTPGEHLFMTPEQRATYNANRGQFSDAYKVIDEINSDLKPFEEVAGVRSSRPIPDGERYFHLQRLGTPESREAAWERAKRSGLPEGFITDAEGIQQSPSGQGGMAYRHMFRKAGAAKQASGQSSDYAVEPFTVFRGRRADVLQAARHNEFREKIRKQAIEVPEGERAPDTITVDGKNYRTARIDLGRNPDWWKPSDAEGVTAEQAKLNSVWVPKPVADMWMDYLTKDPQKQGGIVSRVSDKVVRTGLAATGADVLIHYSAGLDMLSQIPGVGKTVAERVAAKGGIARNLVAIREIADMTSPESQAIRRKLLDSGILRQREAGPQAKEGLEKYSPFRKLTNWMFEPGGEEDAVKVGIYKLLERFAPEMSEAQKLYTTGQVGGVFTQQLQPEIVQRTPLWAAPFVQFGTTKLRNVVTGIAGRRPDFMVNNRGVVGNTSPEVAMKLPATVLSFLALSYLVGDDKDFQETVSHPTTIRIGGKDYPMMRLFSPFSDFGMKVTGLNNMVNSLATGQSAESTITNMARGPVNSLLGYLGPLPAAVMSTLGFAPYLVPDRSDSLMPMRSGTVTSSPVRDVIDRAAWRIIPHYEEASSAPEDPNASFLSKVGGAALAMSGMAGKPAPDIRVAQARAGNEDWRRFNDIASGIASEVRRYPPEKRGDLIKRLVDDRFDEKDRGRGNAKVRAILMKMMKSQQIGVNRARQDEDQ